jgi:hypothetical protein
MLKINCPDCNKSFLWTDDMPLEGKCPTADCGWQYNIHAELKRNIAQRGQVEVVPEKTSCPFCQEEIKSRITICRNCGRIVLGTVIMKKSHFFVAVCVLLIVLSLILKYMVW